jgi:hypothetical protein
MLACNASSTRCIGVAPALVPPRPHNKPTGDNRICTDSGSMEQYTTEPESPGAANPVPSIRI